MGEYITILIHVADECFDEVAAELYDMQDRGIVEDWTEECEIN